MCSRDTLAASLTGLEIVMSGMIGSGVGDYQYKVNNGDVFLFDHTAPHSVSAVDKTTGVWYFLAKWWDVRGGVE